MQPLRFEVVIPIAAGTRVSSVGKVSTFDEYGDQPFSKAQISEGLLIQSLCSGAGCGLQQRMVD